MTTTLTPDRSYEPALDDALDAASHRATEHPFAPATTVAIPGRPDFFTGRASIDPPATGHEALRALAEHEHQQRLAALALARQQLGLSAMADDDGAEAAAPPTNATADAAAVAAEHAHAAALAAAKARVDVCRHRRVTPAALRPELPLHDDTRAGRTRFVALKRRVLIDPRREEALGEVLALLADHGRLSIADLARRLQHPVRFLSDILGEATTAGHVVRDLAPLATDASMLVVEHYALPLPAVGEDAA